MIPALMMALAMAISQAPEAPQVQPMPLAGAPGGPKIVTARSVLTADAGVLLWLRTDDEGVRLEKMEPLWQPIRVERFSEALGDGIWVELLSHRLEVMAAYRGTVPAPGKACGLELPVLRGTWFVLLVERRGEETRLLGQLEVGRELMRLVEEQKIPLAG